MKIQYSLVKITQILKVTTKKPKKIVNKKSKMKKLIILLISLRRQEITVSIIHNILIIFQILNFSFIQIKNHVRGVDYYSYIKIFFHIWR